jgi:geranylgeranyl pyrophosphate synthase
VTSHLTRSPDLESFFEDERDQVDRRLDSRLEAGPPGSLREVMRYSALAPGKRMRPLLAIAAFRACGGRGESVYGPACALELIHAYSLVHDDLPDFDDDALRRGRPTSHVVHGEPLALAAGFALLTEGLAWIAEQPPPLASPLLRLVARSIGLDGMIGGQYLDLRAEGRRVRAAELLEVHAGKTGRLIRSSVLVGALIAGTPAPLLPGLESYGDHLGLAFQIADDLLDALGDAELTGKATGADAAAGKATFVSAFGVEGARLQARAAAALAKREVARLPIENGLLLAIADFVADRAH